MPLFSLFCLFYAFIVESNSTLQKYLTLDYALYVGLSVAVLIIAASFFKKIPELVAYDLFSCGGLLLWFAYWKPLFTNDSPIFFFFPVYFAVSSAIATLFFMSQRLKIDQNNLKLMHDIDSSGVAEPWAVMCLVLVTLYFENHFLQYPVAMTLLITRYVLTGCLRDNPNLRKLDFHS